MYQGRPGIIFRQITDPNGVVRLAKSARKQLLAAIKATEKLQAQSQKQITKTTTRKIKLNVGVDNITANCPRCNSSNPKGAKYCNKCGFRIDNKNTGTGTRQYNTSAPSPNSWTTLRSDNAPMKQVNEIEFLTYESRFYKVKMNYPVSWTKFEKGLTPPGIVCFTSPKEDVYDSYLENVGIGAVLAPKESTLDQYVQTNIDKLKINNPDLKIQESVPTTLANMPAHRLVYDIGRRRHHALILKNLNKPVNQGNNDIFFMILYLAWNNKGFLLVLQRDYQEAIKCYDKAIEIDPTNYSALGNKGMALYYSKYTDAIIYSDQALEIRPDLADSWNNKGINFYKLGNYHEAIKNFNTAILIDPNQSNPWISLGLTFHMLRNYHEAIKNFNTAILIDPRRADVWFDKGVSLDSLQMYTESMDCYNKAIERNQNYADPYFNKGDILDRFGQHEQAIDCYNKAIQINPYDGYAYYARAKAMIKMGNVVKTLADLYKAAEIDDKFIELAKVDKDFESIENDRHFKSLIQD
jgi:tetratricopeptide (TPR) repeat protein